MNNLLHPKDPLFEIFFLLGFVALTVVIFAGEAITYDWLKEREEKNGNDR